MLSRQSARSLTILSTILLALARPPAAHAAEGRSKGESSADETARVQKLNRYAMQLFDDLNFQLAEKTLLEALGVVEKANLANGPAGLATHGNLAVLYSIGLKDPDKAVFHFKKALAIKPDLRMGKQRATPETEANLARAKAELSGGGGTGQANAVEPAGEAKTVEEDTGSGMKCPTGGEIQAGDEITIKCLTSGDLRPAMLMLFYQANGAEGYQVLPMTKSVPVAGVTAWVAKIPGSATKARLVPYYVEARNERGTAVALSGRDDSPSMILVKGANSPAASASAASDDDGADDSEETEEIDDNNPLARLENQRRREREGSKGTWWVSLGVGSGIGYAGGHSTEAFNKPGQRVGFTPGIAVAALGHAVPEIGYFVDRNTALSIAGRDQYVGNGPNGIATGAHTALLRILFFSEDGEQLRWYFAPTVGWGEGFRFLVDAQVIDAATGKSKGTVKDTVRGGPFVAGAGTGVLVKLNKNYRWTIDAQFLAGFSNFSAVLDLTTGIRREF
jgi:hypothetical protein